MYTKHSAPSRTSCCKMKSFPVSQSFGLDYDPMFRFTIEARGNFFVVIWRNRILSRSGEFVFIFHEQTSRKCETLSASLQFLTKTEALQASISAFVGLTERDSKTLDFYSSSFEVILDFFRSLDFVAEKYGVKPSNVDAVVLINNIQSVVENMRIRLNE